MRVVLDNHRPKIRVEVKPHYKQSTNIYGVATIMLFAGLVVFTIESLSPPPFIYGQHNYNESIGNTNQTLGTPIKPPMVTPNSTISFIVNTTKQLKIPLNGSTPYKNDTLTFYIMQKPGGQLSNVTGNSVTYVPRSGFIGQDKFTYRAEDMDKGLFSNNGTVSIEVTATRPPPPPAPLVSIPGTFSSDFYYIIIITLAMLVPVMYDIRKGYQHLTDGKPASTEGLGRMLMTFAIIILLAIVVFDIITTITHNIQSTNPTAVEINKQLVTTVTSIGTVLGGAVSSIIGFYFGSRAATGVTETARPAATGIAVKEPKLSVISTFPKRSGDPIIPSNKTITATFNEEIDPKSINNHSFRLSSAQKEVEGTAARDPNDPNMATFKPKSGLDVATKYTVLLTTEIKDRKDNALASEEKWSFTTKESEL
jgi:hypothetical protein